MQKKMANWIFTCNNTSIKYPTQARVEYNLFEFFSQRVKLAYYSTPRYYRRRFVGVVFVYMHTGIRIITVYHCYVRVIIA